MEQNHTPPTKTPSLDTDTLRLQRMALLVLAKDRLDRNGDRTIFEDVAQAVSTIHALELELLQAQRKLDFLESKGLTVGMMKTSDKPEPYLVYVCKPDSEFDDTIHVNKLIDAEIARDQAQRERDEARKIRDNAISIHNEALNNMSAETTQLRNAVDNLAEKLQGFLGDGDIEREISEARAALTLANNLPHRQQ